MKLGYNTKAKDPTYYVQLGIRNGKKTTTKNIAAIGKHSELLKITDDPLSYAKEQVAMYNEKAKSNNSVTMEVNFDFTSKVKSSSELVSKSTLHNIGYLYLQHIYSKLGLQAFFRDVTKDMKIKFNPDTALRFMTYSRILDPDSKLGSFRNLNNFFEEPDIRYENILRSMDILSDNYSSYIEYLFNGSKNLINRRTSVCYYDCTNYYFETESPDDDYTDEVTGEIIKGLRQYGPSKEHRPNPIVEMGLFMDKDGIPISMCIAPGNENEQKTVIPLEKELIKMLGENNNQFIYCADAGLGSYHIRNFNEMGGRAFIVTQSVKKLSNTLKEAVFNDFDYRKLSDNKPITIKELVEFDKTDEKNRTLYDDKAYKVLEANTLTDVGLYEFKQLQNGKIKKIKTKATLKQYVIITYSRKMMEYQRTIRNRQIERAKKLLKEMDPDTFKKGPNDVTRFIKKTDKSKCDYEIDEARIAEEEKYDGYYAIATNLDDDVKDIIAISEQRYRIEECFRIMKTNFKSRPVYHHRRDRIIAHFMICYTALLIYRILEKQVKSINSKITASNIIDTMKSMEVANIDDLCYMATYEGSVTLNALEAISNLGLNKRYYRYKELSKKV